MTNLPNFDEAGNIILKKPEPVEEIADLKYVADELVKEANQEHRCQYCESEWKTKNSKFRHEAWCKKNPNGRTSHYGKPTTEVAKKPKKPTNKSIKSKDIIKELKAFDKLFCITDEQIVKYIRGKMK